MSRVDQALARANWNPSRGDNAATHGPISLPTPLAQVEADTPSVGNTDLRSVFDPARGGDDVPRLLDRIDERGTERLVIGPAAAEAVEQYRRVAATLHQLQSTRGLKTLLIVSAAPGEGKTVTASNLALTLSESYRRDVLLIDADLRRPSIDRVFKLAPGGGLSEGLKRPEARRIAVRRVSEFLSILPAGVPDPDPMETLSSDRMRHLLTEAAGSFDWVIIDTPPVVLLPDANLLATMADAAILVVRAGVTPYTLVRKAIAAVGRGRLLGMVLNGADPADQPHGHYYYGYQRPAV